MVPSAPKSGEQQPHTAPTAADCLTALRTAVTHAKLTTAERKEILSAFVEAVHPRRDGVDLLLRPLSVDGESVQQVLKCCQGGMAVSHVRCTSPTALCAHDA